MDEDVSPPLLAKRQLLLYFCWLGAHWSSANMAQSSRLKQSFLFSFDYEPMQVSDAGQRKKSRWRIVPTSASQIRASKSLGYRGPLD
jgi:hypothetical protein